MDPRRFVGVLVQVAAVLLLSGCASNDLATPIGKFSQVTKDVAKSITAQQVVIVKATQDRATSEVIASGAPVGPYLGDCDPDAGSHRCRLRAFVVGTNAWPYSNGAFEDAVGDLMASIVAYAENLSAIASAGTPTEIDSATSAVRASTLKLAETVDTVSKQKGNSPTELKATITPYAAPVAELVTFGLEKLIEAKKRTALRAATHQMDPVLQQAVVVFNEISAEGIGLKVIAARNGFEDAEEAYLQNTRDRGKLATYKAAAEKYDDALQTPASVFGQLAEAHHALAVALNRGDMSFQDFWPLLQSVAESATKLASITQQIDAAGKKN